MSGFGRFGRHRKTKELLKAAQSGNKDEVLKLLIEGANVNAKGNCGRTPLHLAVNDGHADVVEVLIAKGANVNNKNNDGWAPLHSASIRGHTDVVEALLAKGANVNNTNNYGWTPLHRASIRGHTDVAKVLLAKGAYVDAMSKDGNTPLHDASKWGHTDVVEALLAKGANIHNKNKYGLTPLHSASIRGPTNVAKVLIARGADIDAVTNNGDTPLDVAKSKGNDSVANLLEAAHAKQNAPILPRATSQNQEMTLNGFDKSKHENVGIEEEPDQRHDKLPDEDGNGKKSGISTIPIDQVQFELTDEDLRFLKMDGELVRDGGNIMPVISIEERSTLRTLATQMVDIERSLESVRELPPSLSDREPEVATYFFSFTNAFARAFTAAQALSSGAVKCDVDLRLESLLGGASWVAENSKLPFVGCVSIFSVIILHQQETKKKNTFMAFEEFFRGNSRDQYLVTYRKLAETFCLQLDISLINEHNPGKAGRLKEQVKRKIVAPIQNYLRKIHLDTILELSPVEAKAMADLASLTKEVLRLHEHDLRTYDELRTSNDRVKASYFVAHIFGKTFIPPRPEQKPSVYDIIQNNSLEPFADKNQPHSTEDGARLQHLLEKIEKMEEQMKEQSLTNANIASTNANMAATNTNIQAQLRKLAEKVNSEKDLTVPSGNQAQVQMNPKKSREDALQREQDFNYAQIEQDIRQLQMQQEKQSQGTEKMKLENFINNRVFSYHEAFELTRRILSIVDPGNGSKIEVSENGRFVLHSKNCCIGTVSKGRLLSKKTTLWKGKLGIKLEEEHRGVKSIMDWFDATTLRPLYERNKKQAIRMMFADELDVEPVLPVVAQPQAQYDRDELFGTDVGPILR